MRQLHTTNLALFAALLTTSALATAQGLQSASDGGDPKYLNLPPNELVHPGQFGTEDFGRTSALAVRSSMPATEPTSSPEPTTTSSQLPTQILDGTFSILQNTPWRGYMRGNSSVIPAMPNIYVPTFAMNLGMPAPAGGPVLRGDAYNVTQTPRCAEYGQLWQDVRVLPGTVLKFNWQAASGTSTTGIAGTLGVSLRDAHSDESLVYFTAPNAQTVAGGRYSEVDLSRFAGLDLRVRFDSKPRPVNYPFATCNNTTWVDNVSLEQRTIAYRNVLPTAGQWYNPLRAGSGWDLRRLADGRYFGAWYTFQNGAPVWYFLDLASVSNGTFETSIRRIRRIGASSEHSIVGRARLRMLAADKGLMSFDFYDQPNTASGWDNTEWFQLLMPGGGSMLNGQWFDNRPEDPNWGIATLVIPDNRLFSTQYFYDEAGTPTWTFATGSFVNSGTLPVTRVVGGLCPNCPGTALEVQHTTVGALTLAYPDSTGQTMTAAFSAGSWVRPMRTFYKLSN